MASSSLHLPSPFPGSRSVLSYHNRVVLAPMVRVGTLPFRLMCLDYGADIVYSEEIIDRKIAKTRRIYNDELDCIEYRRDSHDGNELGELVFSTCGRDHPVVFQMGTGDAVHALEAAHRIYEDVDAIDINMGCPKEFSVQGGMGSALLSRPQTVKEILTSLVQNVPRPITCKIRLLERFEDTVDFVRLVRSCGVSAVAVHGRYIPQRSKTPPHYEQMKRLSDLFDQSEIPFIANGDILHPDDIAKTRELTGMSSVMIARGAMYNPSIFCGSVDRSLSRSDVALRMIDDFEKYGIPTKYIKYILLKMYEHRSTQDLYRKISESKDINTWREVAISDPCLSGEGVFHARVPDPLLFGTPSAVSTNLCSSNGKRSLDTSDYNMDTVQSACESSTSEYGSVTSDGVGSFDMKRAKRE